MIIAKHFIVKSFLKQMRKNKSTSLNLSNLELNSLPDEIIEYQEIEKINLYWNRFSIFPKQLFKLENLKEIDFSANNIKEIPKEILNLKFLNNINFSENPLIQPPIEVANRGLKAIRNYFYSIEEEGTVRLFEAKLLIVGQGSVGKTCLIKKLINPNIRIEQEELSTEGIDIYRWDIKTEKYNHIRLNFWDFGGQEIYHATHQFFLTKRSLYIFAWEARKDEINFDYWLNVIKLLSNDSPLLVVNTKIDDRIRNVDEAFLMEKFPIIVGFHKVSSKTGSGIIELQDSIKNEVQKLEHLGDKLPKVWFNIRKYLESLNRDFIDYNEYLILCSSYGLNKEKADYLSQYYHDLGVFLHFQDNTILSNILFLRPEWATNAVYKLIDARSVQFESGRFHFNQLSKIWSEYPSEKHIYLVELMKKFELCFQIGDTSDYIVPELLKPSQPENFQWDNTNNLVFVYKYDFMPAGIITRFIVRNHDLILKKLYWRNGVVLWRENTTALIVSDPLSRSIKIMIKGIDGKSLLSIIRRDVELIHKSLNYPPVNEMIICKCNECINSNKPYFHNYHSILKAKSKDKNSIECQHSFEAVPIDLLLGEVENLASTSPEEITINYYDNSMNVYQGNGYKIEKGDLNIIGKNYKQNLKISERDFEELRKALNALPQKTLGQIQDSLVEISSISDIKNRESKFIKIKEFLVSNGYSISQGITSSVLYEALKYLLLG